MKNEVLSSHCICEYVASAARKSFHNELDEK